MHREWFTSVKNPAVWFGHFCRLSALLVRHNPDHTAVVLAGHGKGVEGRTKEESPHLSPADHCKEHIYYKSY